MAKQITESAVEHINNTPTLYVEIAELLNISMSSMATYLIRKRTVLARYDIIVKVANSMNVEPETILEEKTKELFKV